MLTNHSTFIIYKIWLKFFYSQDFIKQKKKKRSSYETSIIMLWFWFVKHGWNFSNNLCIKKEIMNNFAIKIIFDEDY